MDIKKDQSAFGENFDRYEVHNRLEIARLIRGMLAERVRVSIQAVGSPASYMTVFVGLDEENGWAYVERLKDNQVDEALLAGNEVELGGKYEEVLIQLRVSGAVPVEHGGLAAYRIDLPEKIYRFQRREYYRLRLPLLNSPKCTLRLNGQDVETKVVDISIGGLRLSYETRKVLLTPGLVVQEARLSLPDTGVLSVALKVVNRHTHSLPNGAQVQRAGCEFQRLPASVERAIQTYIFKKERQKQQQGG